ncbi:helix-turn-helix transcriptional regulator [Thermobifida halotolerans]|uniref:Helix-turn-helix transcriptional regulator n=1 Tax=Thermobifida halotolerans TaxID=483545 RepID=A0A399G7K1_9ACTN|nr:TetR/AcrR family transcriptional regulator [Thermobifida halotolerans]UOE21193.1 helix-turn-helix transcriptional regulator [Thermobifida halotolerans]
MSETSQPAPRRPSRAATDRGDGRAARARATRARILAAATRLFTASGYTATSIGAIAAEAGVGEQTVYYSFGTKRAVLTRALDVAVAGDDAPVPTLERPWVRAALDTPDPAEQVRLQVAGAGDIHLRAAPLLDVVRSAAATDPDLAEVWNTNVEQRHTVQRVLAEALARKAPLRGGMGVDDAADIALALLSPETYHLLVRVRGWTHERWRSWAADALLRQLLDTSR